MVALLWGIIACGLSATFAVTAVMTIHTGTQGQTSRQRPDDGSLWTAGLIYNNPDDPSLLVPKRVGTGWTVNWGRPAGKAMTLTLLLLILAGVVTAVVVGSTSG